MGVQILRVWNDIKRKLYSGWRNTIFCNYIGVDLETNEINMFASYTCLELVSKIKATDYSNQDYRLLDSYGQEIDYYNNVISSVDTLEVIAEDGIATQIYSINVGLY